MAQAVEAFVHTAALKQCQKFGIVLLCVIAAFKIEKH